jgi:hypothetical protein
MIKVNEGVVELAGNRIYLEAEFSTLVYTLITDTNFGEECTRDLVERAFDTAKKFGGKSKEEQLQMIKEEMKSEMDKSFEDMFNSLFSNKED